MITGDTLTNKSCKFADQNQSGQPVMKIIGPGAEGPSHWTFQRPQWFGDNFVIVL
jgi:hypothetical protein